MKEIVLAKYGEIILKGGNRPKFERLLIDNIKSALKNVAKCRVTLTQATIYIEDFEEDKISLIIDRLSKIFGIVSITRAAVCEKDMEIIKATAREYLADDLSEPHTFKVEAKRSDKGFPLNSVQICREVGGYLDDVFEK